MSDLIDRQAALDAMNRLREDDLETYGVEIPESFDAERANEAIRNLPTAEPEYDMIYCQNELTDDDIEELKRQMKTWKVSLLTAEPKKGKWTKENACEFCGYMPWYERDIHTLSFCPNCGADMRGEKNG